MHAPAAPIKEASRRPRFAAIWSIAWALFAVVHVTQSIWLSGGAAYPGDLGDGRFNQLLLEHGHQALRGMATWDSPGQFYPAQHTLALSDTHAGTLPIYTILRRLGISREDAWQLWFIVVATLNVVAAFRLFRALGVADAIRGPAVFASAGSASLVWLTGAHMQMLPIFPALLAWEQAVKWLEDRNRWRLVAGFGWFAWQFAAGPYSAFFAAVIGAWTGLARFALGALPSRSPAPRVVGTQLRLKHRLGAIIVLAAGGGLAAATLWVYIGGLRSGHSRDLADLARLSPVLSSWFSASPVRVFYPPGWPGGQQEMIEQAWFAGFIPWLLLTLTLTIGWRRRDSATAIWSIALAISAIGTMVFFTKWGAGENGLWLWLVTHVEPLRAFRAAARVAALLQFVLIGSAALTLSRCLTASSRLWLRTASVIAACLLAVENLSHHQPFTLLCVAQERTNALVEAWQLAGDRPVLAFAPGFTNHPDAWIQLDAWSAALARHRVTVNGYSGGAPQSHWLFEWNPTPAHARDLLRSNDIADSDVSIVEDFPAQAAHRLDFHRLAERQLKTLDDFDLQPIGWSLFTPVESFEVDGRPMYQFTPPAAVRFALPAASTHFSINVRMRDGSFDGAGHSDGIGITWLLLARNAAEVELRRAILNPREQVTDRATLQYDIVLPPGEERVLVLRVDAGRSDDNAWDWPLFGAVRVR